VTLALCSFDRVAITRSTAGWSENSPDLGACHSPTTGRQHPVLLLQPIGVLLDDFDVS
jgi:hypothetical protein